jgi:hypothetical protein
MTCVAALVKTPLSGVSITISYWLQGAPGVRQSQPDSFLQPELQPSRLLVLPSSHCSAASSMPLPQVGPQTLGWPPQE